jgi:hypothetical protein
MDLFFAISSIRSDKQVNPEVSNKGSTTPHAGLQGLLEALPGKKETLPCCRASGTPKPQATETDPPVLGMT